MDKPPIVEDMWMETVSSCTCTAHDAIENELKKRKISLTVEQSEWLWEQLWKPLEDLSNGNYKREL